MGDAGWAGFRDGVSVLHCALVSAWAVFMESVQSFGCSGSMELRGPKIWALGYAYGVVRFVVDVPCVLWGVFWKEYNERTLLSAHPNKVWMYSGVECGSRKSCLV
jgi:hypothetical protein